MVQTYVLHFVLVRDHVHVKIFTTLLYHVKAVPLLYYLYLYWITLKVTWRCFITMVFSL